MNPLPIELHPSAVVEAASAQSWYSEIEITLGLAFSDELDHAIECIADAPLRWTPHLHGTRCFFLRRFPFLIIYRPLADVVQIIAIPHTRRHPDYWKRRLK